MELVPRLRLLLFGVILVLPSWFLLYEFKKLNGYEFPVYSAEYCPRNEAEWNQRSTAINCTSEHGYVCLPNENITGLLEFCYESPFILIEEDICLYLSKRYSAVYTYSCTGFLSGCPNYSHVSYKLFENPQCTSIGNGCFLAEPSCQSLKPTMILQEATEHNRLEGIIEWATFGTTCGVFIITCFCFICFLFIGHRKGKRNFERNKDIEKNENEEPLILHSEPDIKESSVEGKRNPERKRDVEKNENKEPFLSQNQPDINESGFEELPADQACFKRWQKDDKKFVETKASREAERLAKSRNIVIVTGHSGSGKSAILHHVALKYRCKGWKVTPVVKVKEIIQIINSSKHALEGKFLFVLNDPIGKESLDEMKFTSWRNYEENLKACLSKIKLLLSSRKYILSDDKVKGLLKDKSNIVDITNDQFKFSKEEKRKILEMYEVDKKVSQEVLMEILHTESYFPLLCELCVTENVQPTKILKLFRAPVESLKDEIRDFRLLCKDKYCALVLLVLFNNNVCVEDLRESEISREKYELALELCGMEKTTASHMIGDALETLQGFFVIRIGDTFHFHNDFVMEVTTFVLGEDYPSQIIKFADIDFLRKRVRLECCNSNDDQFTLSLSNKYSEALGKRLFNDIFGERFLDVVLNPCLKCEEVIKMFIKEMDNQPEKIKLLLEKQKHHIDEEEFNQMSGNLYLPKLVFASLQESLSPLSAIIIFCDTTLSLHCLQALQKLPQCYEDNSLFCSVCCNGSEELFIFNKDHVRKFCREKWNFLYPIHIASAFNNKEILTELIQNGADVNQKTANENFLTPLTLAAGNDTYGNEENDMGTSSPLRREVTLQILLDYKADINSCAKNGASPLLIASQKGYDHIVQLLLSNGADIDLCKKDGTSPLYVACEFGHKGIVQLLLSNKADIGIRLEDGASSLHVASRKGHGSILQLLLSNGADINLCMKDGASPLHVACRKGRENIVQILLSNGADIDLCMKDGASPLYVACEFGHIDIVQLLLRYKADINIRLKDGASSLHVACRKGHESILQFLLSNGADINLCMKDGASPLHVACRKGRENIVQILLSNGADINLCMKDGAGPLITACQHGRYGIVQLLLSNGADINLCKKDGASPLYVACEFGHIDIVQLLLRNRAVINIRFKDGASSLHVACRKGHESILQLLLSNGADINLCMKDGASPLITACQHGRHDIVQSLLSNGADINTCLKNGDSPLYIACQHEYVSIVQLLLSNGADINSCNEDGASPLYIACDRGYESIVQYLLSYGSNINLCLKNGPSPLYVACQHGLARVVQLLLRNGKDISSSTMNGALFISRQRGHNNIVELLQSNGKY